MKPFKDYEKIRPATDRVKIPAGGYEAVILSALVKEYPTFSRLEIAIDITQGEFKDYYKNDFNAQQSEDKRWKGVLRQYIPVDDGSDKDNWTKSTFKALIEAIEDSNSGFHWDWDEKKLKNKKIGVLLRDEEYDYNGYQGMTAKPFKFIDIAKVRNGEFTVPKPKKLNNDTSGNVFSNADSSDFVEIATDAGDYPF